LGLLLILLKRNCRTSQDPKNWESN